MRVPPRGKDGERMRERPQEQPRDPELQAEAEAPPPRFRSRSRCPSGAPARKMGSVSDRCSGTSKPSMSSVI